MSLPITVLQAIDAGRIEDHLLLDPIERSLRFTAGVVTDETIRDAGGALVAFAHGCVYTVGKRARVEVAFGVDADRRELALGAAGGDRLTLDNSRAR